MDIKRNNASGIVHALEIPASHHSYSLKNMNPYHSSHKLQKGQSRVIQISCAFLYPTLLHSTEEPCHQLETSLTMSFYQKDTLTVTGASDFSDEQKF